VTRWEEMTNDDLALHLEFWLVADGTVSTDNQKTFFEEVAWRLRLMVSIEEDV